MNDQRKRTIAILSSPLQVTRATCPHLGLIVGSSTRAYVGAGHRQDVGDFQPRGIACFLIARTSLCSSVRSSP